MRTPGLSRHHAGDGIFRPPDRTAVRRRPRDHTSSMRPEHATATSKPHGPDARVRSSVDLPELAFRPLHGILRRRALDRLCVHIDDDVLGQHLGRLLARGAGEAGRLAELACNLEGAHYWIGPPR